MKAGTPAPLPIQAARGSNPGRLARHELPIWFVMQWYAAALVDDQELLDGNRATSRGATAASSARQPALHGRNRRDGFPRRNRP